MHNWFHSCAFSRSLEWPREPGKPHKHSRTLSSEDSALGGTSTSQGELLLESPGQSRYAASRSERTRSSSGETCPSVACKSNECANLPAIKRQSSLRFLVRHSQKSVTWYISSIQPPQRGLLRMSAFAPANGHSEAFGKPLAKPPSLCIC